MRRCIFKARNVVVLLIIFSITVFLSSFNVSAETEVVDVINITVPAACTLETTSGSGETYNVSLMPAQYEDDIGPTPISVFCNTNDGFSIYAIGYSNEEYGNTKMLSNDPAVYFDTGTNTSGTPSSWAMKLEAVTSSGAGAYTPTIVSPFNNYANVPTSYAKVATVANSATATAEASLNAYYAVYISPAQLAGNYTGKVRYTIVNPSSNVPNEPKSTTGGYIGYYPNAGNTVADTMSDIHHTIGASDTEATLWASNFKRPGYGFAGWSDAFDYVANIGSESNPNAHIYGPNETITFTAGQYSTSGLSLYAVWVRSAGSLQGWTCPDNTTMPVGTVTALTDQRDNDTYAVAKLADGKCWMIENLRLDYTNSDNSTGSLSQGYGGQFVGLAQPETANFLNSTTANSLYKSDGSGDVAGVNGATLTDIGITDSPANRFPRYHNSNTNTDNTINPNTTIANMTSANQNVYSYGNHYSWPAAKANTSYLTFANSNATSTSLCPSGWRLPQGGDKANQSANDFWSLIVTGINNGTNPANYDSSNYPLFSGSDEANPVVAKLRTFPNNFVYSGRVYNNNISYAYGLGSGGYYWSATAINYSDAFGLFFATTVVWPGTDYQNKYHGWSIRCVTSPSA